MPFSRGTLLISVRMFAGSMQLQRMPRSKNEAEMLRVRPSTACLVVTYIAPPFRPRRDAAEATLTMFGRRALLEEDPDCALAAQEHGALVGFVDHVVDLRRRLVDGELTVEHAGVVDEDVQMAELLEAGVEHGLDLCGSRTSVLTGRMTPGAFSAATLSRRSSRRFMRRAAATTFAPSMANSRAVERPMPELAPVTMTTLPSKRIFSMVFVLLMKWNV